VERSPLAAPVACHVSKNNLMRVLHVIFFNFRGLHLLIIINFGLHLLFSIHFDLHLLFNFSFQLLLSIHFGLHLVMYNGTIPTSDSGAVVAMGTETGFSKSFDDMIPVRPTN